MAIGGHQDSAKLEYVRSANLQNGIYLKMTKDNVRAHTNWFILKKGIKRICSVCGSTYRIEAHHNSYLDYKNFVLLCKKHHCEAHGISGDYKLWGDKRKRVDGYIVQFVISSTVKNQLQKLADENERTLAGQIRLALAQWIENQEGRAGIAECPGTANNKQMAGGSRPKLPKR